MLLPGREHVDAGDAVVGERRARVTGVGGADADQVRLLVRARVLARVVVVVVADAVGAAVAGRDHEQRARMLPDRPALGLRRDGSRATR